jgi:hypothetical protein
VRLGQDCAAGTPRVNLDEVGDMHCMLTATTGATVAVWREDDMFHAQPPDGAFPPEVCLAVDLFEVIAELAGLDLDVAEQSAEAVLLAKRAQETLAT